MTMATITMPIALIGSPRLALRVLICFRFLVGGTSAKTHNAYGVNRRRQHLLPSVLVAAGKQFELMVYPMRKHTFLDKAAIKHRAETMLDFWKRNL